MTDTSGTTALIAVARTAMRSFGPEATADEIRDGFPAKYEAVLREQYGGQTLRFHIRKPVNPERERRDQRIEAALSSGETPAVIAQREDVSKRHMRRIRARFG